MSSRTDLLSSDFLSKLSRLSYLLKKKASLQEGLHLGSDSGGHFEFEDYRLYHPGEDLRHLDWNVYARTEKFYLKRFSRERDQFIAVFLDLSNRMDFGHPNKLDRALQITAGLAYLTLHQKSKIKIFAGAKKDSKIYHSPRHLPMVLKYLMGLQAAPNSGIRNNVRRILAQRPQSMVVISDFLEPFLFQEFQYLLGKRSSFGLIQILAPEEENPPWRGWWNLKSVETSEIREFRFNPEILQRYKHLLGQYRESLRTFSLKHSLFFQSHSSALPLESWLENLHLEGNLFVR
ncbi:MAG: DUF58 domain-containing protein [Planctomycetota bacterium]